MSSKKTRKSEDPFTSLDMRRSPSEEADCSIWQMLKANMFFSAEERVKIKEELPDLEPKEVTREITKRWKLLKEAPAVPLDKSGEIKADDCEAYKREWIEATKKHLHGYLTYVNLLSTSGASSLTTECLANLRVININFGWMLWHPWLMKPYVFGKGDSFQMLEDFLARPVRNSDIKEGQHVEAIGMARKVTDVERLQGEIFDRCEDGETLVANFVQRQGRSWRLCVIVPTECKSREEETKFRSLFPDHMNDLRFQFKGKSVRFVTRICCLCEKKAKKLCGRCGEVYYCGVTCQKADWKTHRPACKKS